MAPLTDFMKILDKSRLALAMVRHARNEYGTGYLPLLARFVLVTGRRYSPIEIAQLDLLNLTETGPSLDAFVSKDEFLALQARLNPPALDDDTEDKKRFDDICRAHGLPVPEIIAELFNDPESARAQEGIVSADKRRIADVVAEIPANRYVLKPAAGCGGQGVHRFDVPGDATARQQFARELESRLHEFAEYRHWLIQEWLENHDEVNAICTSEALQTVRVVTYLDRNRVPHLLAAQWRLAAPGSTIDNFSFGTRTNLLCNIDIGTGEIEVVFRGKEYPREFGLERYTHHPDTGLRLGRRKIPFWGDVVGLCKRAAVAFFPSRSIGWDIALSKRGLVIIEGNRFWDPHNEDEKMMQRVNVLKQAL